jgi:aryl-alcohol dehydrogenase-like predicted oxidoreductase
MNYRKFGNTDMKVSQVGFGAWAIGGPAFAGTMPIGWGNSDDKDSIAALKKSLDCGINFYDTADFYGLGHSEKLIGKVFGNSDKVIIATKVGQKLGKDKPVDIDYSKSYIINACEKSLKRLNRECIDYYQLHVANITHLQQGECLEAMTLLQQQGKIRYWGISLFTFNPFPEAEYMMQHKLGSGFQLVFNIINQKALPLLKQMQENGYGVIARMPLQFGLLAGKFSPSTQFDESDHRSFRLTPAIIAQATAALQKVWPLADQYNISKAALALNFILSFSEVSTIIPGIRTAEQALLNTKDIRSLTASERDMITSLYPTVFEPLVKLFRQQG